MDRQLSGILSLREQQIAKAYANGASYREIAEDLFIASGTVRKHLNAIYRKLAVSSKIELLKALERIEDEKSTDSAEHDEMVATKTESANTATEQGMRSSPLTCILLKRLLLLSANF